MKALLIIDIQNDFLPGGALAVSGGDKVIPVINKLMEEPFDLIIASKDWHPHGHMSFADSHNKKPRDIISLKGNEQILWPQHCIQNTYGAEFPKELHADRIEKVIYKGVDHNIDSYSAFYDNRHERSTGLAEFLREKKVDEVVIVGLATDYCVKFSALDALHEGFKTTVIEEACRGVNLHPDDSRRAIDEMRSAGAIIQ